MGLSPDHASTVPLVLNLDTGVITPKFHVVFHDCFTTVATSVDDLPDFNSAAWLKMFGDSEYQSNSSGMKMTCRLIKKTP